MNYTNEELLDSLRKEYKNTGKTPSSISSPIHQSVYRRRFGSWNKALEAAGVPKRPQKDASITKECLNCGKDFKTKLYKETNFCSVVCSNTSRRKPGWKPKIKRSKWLEHHREQKLKTLLKREFDELGWDYKRQRVIFEQNNCCNKCGLNEWMGHPIILEIDHINGDNHDDRRENLEGLCPNCHSLTETWKGRNKRNNARNKITDEELMLALKETSSVRQALIKVGMAAKGGNYIRAKYVKEKLDTSH